MHKYRAVGPVAAAVAFERPGAACNIMKTQQKKFPTPKGGEANVRRASKRHSPCRELRTKLCTGDVGCFGEHHYKAMT
jgi:hypothetical protein